MLKLLCAGQVYKPSCSPPLYLSLDPSLPIPFAYLLAAHSLNPTIVKRITIISASFIMNKLAALAIFMAAVSEATFFPSYESSPTMSLDMPVYPTETTPTETHPTETTPMETHPTMTPTETHPTETPTAFTTPESIVYTTEVLTAYTTYCPGPTTITHGESTYTVTSATTLTITNCPFVPLPRAPASLPFAPLHLDPY